MHANFPYGTSAAQGSNMHGFKELPTKFSSSSYSNELQLESSSGENLNSTIMENTKTNEQL